jgi:phenylalanyl-tRNA synthetase beta chain
MNVSYRWLKDYVETDLPAAEAARVLTHVGLNVDEMHELPGGDTFLLVEVTSNRPDCLGLIGIARELAAAVGTTVRFPEAAPAEAGEPAADAVRVDIEEPDLCPLYTARLVRGVKVGPSPDWLRARLEAAGLRPVNNIVDVTNYVMLECGQPLHAFDFRWIEGGRIVVRRAVNGEHFYAIDHSEHTLTPDRLVIADSKRAVALAGVMGGADTEIADATRDVLLEAAVFDPLCIRNTSRTLAMQSDSSYRYERRVDAHLTDWAGRRACRLILETAGGALCRGVVTAGRPLAPARELALRVGRLEAILGLAIAADAAAGILARLECEVLDVAAGVIRVRVPHHRSDLEREIDLVEEVARHFGYDKIPESPHTRAAIAMPSRRERVRETIGHVMTAAGYHEAVTFTFTTPDHAARFRPREVTARPLVCRGTALAIRESLLAGVMESLRVNRGVGEHGARLFEVAKRFVPIEGEVLPREESTLALAGAADFLAARGVVEALVASLGLAGRTTIVATDRYADLEPGAAAEIRLDGEAVGMLGLVTEAAAEAFEVSPPVVVAEIALDPIIERAVLEPRVAPLPQFPAMERDLAVVVDEGVPWGRIEAAVRGAGVAELETLRPLDVYRGKQVPPGKKSVALRFTLRSPVETLTHEKADAMQARILDALGSQVGGTLRQ